MAVRSSGQRPRSGPASNGQNNGVCTPTRTSAEHSAPDLTTIGYINWGKAEEAEPTNSSDSSSTQIPTTL